MIRALNTAATGMQSQDSMVNNIANNIANVNTNGFKGSRTEFEDLLYDTVKEAGEQTTGTASHTVGHQVGSGSRVVATRKEFTQGPTQVTNNPYDLSIQGEGFFGIVGANEERYYTRDGSFTVSASGEIQTKSGHKLFPGFTVPQNTTHLHVAENGTVEAYIKNQVEPTNLGKLPVFTFVNAAGLKSMGGNLYAQTAGSGDPQEQEAGRGPAGSVMQGSLEGSNVNIMSEMTNLIKAQRAYEMNSKVMGVADQMLQTINNVK
jgi:flagellar basal-body rod protein FlgG